MSKMLLVIVSAAAMSLSATLAVGADPKSPPNVQERAEEALREGAEKIMRALELMMLAVPQYEMPKVLENGDIIIRRRKPDSPERRPRPKPPNETDETAT